MAAKTGWHRYGTKLRHCHAMCTTRRLSIELWDSFDACGVSIKLWDLGGTTAATRVVTGGRERRVVSERCSNSADEQTIRYDTVTVRTGTKVFSY